MVMREVTKRHGDTLAVDRLSLTIRKGEFFAILGPSGSGKTTTLRLLAGFEQPDAGEIIIEGQPMQGVPPNRRPVNLVFQNYALFPHMTVAQNVAFGLEMKGLQAAEIGPRVAEALEMVRLAGKQNRLPSQLSGGEQRSEEHTSELQSLAYLVCRLLLEKKKAKHNQQKSISAQQTRECSRCTYPSRSARAIC